MEETVDVGIEFIGEVTEELLRKQPNWDIEHWVEEVAEFHMKEARLRIALASAQERIEELEKAGTHALGTLKGIYHDGFIPDVEKVVKTCLIQSISKLEHTLTPLATH